MFTFFAIDKNKLFTSFTISDNLDAFNFNLIKFDEIYMRLNPNYMWTLKSDYKVKEVIYRFVINLHGKLYLHLFIINDIDANAKSLFLRNYCFKS